LLRINPDEADPKVANPMAVMNPMSKIDTPNELPTTV
jgi:hypothetical protein